jgi:hypothetical protein
MSNLMKALTSKSLTPYPPYGSLSPPYAWCAHLTIVDAQPITPRIVSGFRPFNRAQGRRKVQVAFGGIYTKSGGFMKDRDMSKAHRADSIIELTPDMEQADDSLIDIIELTDIVDSPEGTVPPAPPVSEPPPVIGKTSPKPLYSNAIFSAIERQVEAAFDYVQSPICEAEPTPQDVDEGLIDRLSDIPNLVDNALETPDEPAPAVGDAADRGAPEAGPHGLDVQAQEDLAKGAAELDAALSGFELDEVDDEIIELTNIVDPRELQAAPAREGDDEEIIELTDIVDPRELQAAHWPMDDDDEIIELTDIVDPAELRVSAVIAEPDETESRQETVAEDRDDQTADAALEDDEYEDLLEMIDTLDAEDLLVGIDEDLTDEGWDLAPDEETADSEPALAADEASHEAGGELDETQADASTEDQEYEDLLETIDMLDPDDLLVSIDEAGLLESADDVETAAEPAAPNEDGVLTLLDVLNGSTPEAEDKPPADQLRADAGDDATHRTDGPEAEEETGRKVRALTDQEVEAAVERILKSKYAETIERIIANAVEKAVNREIEIIKRAMLDGDEPLA